MKFVELEKIARKINNNILSKVNLFDVYQGDNLPKGKKSYALSFIFEDYTKTLTDKHVDAIMAKLMKEYVDALGAEVR